MLSSKRTDIIFKEFLFIFIGFFIVTAIAEINKPHVVIRVPAEFLLIAFYSLSFYFIILSIRIIFWAIKKCFFSYYHAEVDATTRPSYIKKLKLNHLTRFLKNKSPKGKMSKIIKPLYALNKIRSLF